MAQSVKCLALGFGSGHDLTVPGFEPSIRLSADSAELAWDSLSPSLSAPPPSCTHTTSISLSLPLKRNKVKKKKKELLPSRDKDSSEIKGGCGRDRRPHQPFDIQPAPGIANKF